MNLKYTRLSLGLLFLVVLSLAGCGFQPLRYFGLVEPARDEVLPMQLKDGNRFFLEKNFKAAEEIFERLVNSENLLVARVALYGMACTRLMLAESDVEYRDAARLLDQWWEGPSGSFGLEDPRMLLSVFTKVMPRRPGGSSEKSANALSPEEPLMLRGFGYEKEIDDLRQAVESRNVSVKAMKKELETLRDQIKIIETIDQKIQEKKQGISSP